MCYHLRCDFLHGRVNDRKGCARRYIPFYLPKLPNLKRSFTQSNLILSGSKRLALAVLHHPCGGAFGHFEADADFLSLALEVGLDEAVTGVYGDLCRGEVAHLRTDLELLETGCKGCNAGYILREKRECTPTPCMVHRTSSEACLANAPTFPQGGTVRIVHHVGKAFTGTLEGHFGIAHHKQCLAHIFLHVRTGMAFLLEHFQYLRILFGLGESRQYGESLSAVVRLALIARRTVFLSRPEPLVEGGLHACHHLADSLYIFFHLEQSGKFAFALQCQVIPCVEQEVEVDVLPPVAPRPVSVTGDDESVRIGLPYLVQIALHAIVHLRDEAVVATVQIIGVETIMAHGSQHLCRQFLTTGTRRTWRENHAIVALPGHEFEDALVGQLVSAKVGGIEGFAQLVHLVAPPLGALAVGTVHIGVAHGDIQGAYGLFAQAVEEIVVAGESARKLGVIARFAILQGIDFHAFRNLINERMSVHPTQGFIGLTTFLGDILRTHIRFASSHEMVSLHPDFLARRSRYIEVRSCMAVVRKLAIEGIHFGSLVLFDGDIFLDAKILPKRYGTLHEVVPRRHACFAQGNRPMETRVGILFCPSCIFLACIETDAGFGQTPVGMRSSCLLVGFVRLAFPRGIRKNPELLGLTIEEQTGLTTAVVREPVLAEIPQEDGDGVLPFREIRGNVHAVVVGVSGVGTSFQSSLKHHQLAIDPHPVLAVHGNVGIHGRTVQFRQFH